MSLSKIYNIQCPSCGVQQDVDLYEVVNAAESPELKQALMQNQLNRIQCSDCDANFRVDMPLLYTDPPRDLVGLVVVHVAGGNQQGSSGRNGGAECAARPYTGRAGGTDLHD